MSEAPVIMWFRSDLRLRDNTALNAALRSDSPVIPVFIFDLSILQSDRTGAPRVAFMLKALRSLDKSLRNAGTALLVRQGEPVAVMTSLVKETGATAIYVNRDYSPYARRRDAAVESSLSVPVHSFDDSLLVAPGDVLKKDNTPYTVFTPFNRQWLNVPKAVPETVNPVAGQLATARGDALSVARLTLETFGFGPTIAVPEASESAAQQRLADFLPGSIYRYEQQRNWLAAEPEDALPTTSYLSAYFHLGLLSIREAYQAAMEAAKQANDREARDSVETWVSELCWREFYQHILFHFPHVAHGNFRPKYDALLWRDAPDELLTWKEGRTGYPVVDAAMRQLRQVGWMPNRARMIVASFLTKHLLIDWREGERHFMQWLVDGDLAANNGGWQWAAGTGTDAQPYFRIFNPVSQSRKFDPDGAYIRRWIPELRDLDSPSIHAPWELRQPPTSYPPPIVDHSVARQRALDAFSTAIHSQNVKE